MVEQYMDGFDDFSQVKTWTLRNKLAPKNTIEPPAAKKDLEGNLITKKEDIEELYLKTYESRLKPNPVSDEIKELKDLKDYLFSLRYNLAEKDVTVDWTEKDLEKALKSLKNNKARDVHGLTYELFKYGGRDLKLSLLQLFNKIKRSQIYPSICQVSNITSFWKKKGDRSDIDNDRGVFNVTKIRSILDKMIYNNDIYQYMQKLTAV